MYKSIKVHDEDYNTLKELAKEDNNRPLVGTLSIIIKFFRQEQFKKEVHRAKANHKPSAN